MLLLRPSPRREKKKLPMTAKYHFDTSKIPEIFDNIYYDLTHRREELEALVAVRRRFGDVTGGAEDPHRRLLPTLFPGTAGQTSQLGGRHLRS